MPIMYVNGKRRGARARGRAKVGKLARRPRARRNKMPPALARYWKAKRSSAKARKRVKPVSRRKSRRIPSGSQVHRAIVAAADIHIGPAGKKPRARRRARKGSSSVMAKRKRKRKSSSAVVKRRHRRKAAAAPKKRRRKRRSSTPKRRHRRKAAAAPKKRRRKRRVATPKRRRRARKGSARKRHRKGRRRARRTHRRRRSARRVVIVGASGKTLAVVRNPRRHRRYRRNSGRMHRRYRRAYRRNPGGMLIDLAKQAAPVLIGLYGSRLLVSKIGPMLPLSALGTFQGPVLAIGTVLGVHFATKKIGALAKYRQPLMLGAALSALDSLISAFAPASIKSMIGVGDIYDRGMGDYVQMGDYLSVGATPIDDNIAMSDYIAVGSDGVQEELGLEEELGVEEELGNDLLGGVSGTSLMKTVPGRQFLEPVPARSFTQPIPAAGGQYDNPGSIYQGVFRGGF